MCSAYTRQRRIHNFFWVGLKLILTNLTETCDLLMKFFFTLDTPLAHGV